MKKLMNTIQHYAWGSTTALTELYGIANPTSQPMAELWMGAHPQSSSKIFDDNHQEQSLYDVIEKNKPLLLGEDISKRFGELPFLFKILCAAQPLSIQVHPNKKTAEQGFLKENAEDIAINDPKRNYKDANHKPELVYALTPFLAMNGFRQLDEMQSLLSPFKSINETIDLFIDHPKLDTLPSLFTCLLSLSGQEKQKAFEKLHLLLSEKKGQPWEAIHNILHFYPEDNGVFSPLILNIIELQPGDAMFLYAQTPHAYLHGSALEIMANSDNVLRAGLTPKYIDIPELLSNVKFECHPTQNLLMKADISGNRKDFPIPVADFALSLYKSNHEVTTLIPISPAITLCLEGELTLKNAKQEELILQKGESCFIDPTDYPLIFEGVGELAHAYVK